MEGAGLASQGLCQIKLIHDDSSPAVCHLIKLVKSWDRQHRFDFISLGNNNQSTSQQLAQLQQSRHSLLLIDEDNVSWTGADAIPFILKNLPCGRVAAALYILPGTMWLTQLLYHLICHRSSLFGKPPSRSCPVVQPQAADQADYGAAA